MAKTLNYPRVLLAATSSGAGKTTITTGILKLLAERGMDIHAFKCGPDYIDPMYHEAVLSVPSKNLDPYFYDEKLLRASFVDGAGDMNVIEGCMGLYDGMGISSDKSPYEIARILACPIILIVDASRKGYSIIAEIRGFLDYDREGLIQGIILNQISEGYYKRLTPVIEAETGMKVLGFLPRLSEDCFESRHLGLKSITENEAKEKIDHIADIMRQSIQLEALSQLATKAPALSCNLDIANLGFPDLSGKCIAIARDEAFNFYYKDNLEALSFSGARLVEFSPIRDQSLPDDIDAIYLGGGYPELYARELTENESMRREIRAFVEAGKALYAECGGFLYLQENLEGEQMVGLFSGHAENAGHLVRFGYVEATYQGLTIRGHEFHHYDVEDPGELMEIKKASTMQTYRAFCRYRNCIAGFPHLSFLSQPAMIEYLFGGEEDESRN